MQLNNSRRFDKIFDSHSWIEILATIGSSVLFLDSNFSSVIRFSYHWREKKLNKYVLIHTYSIDTVSMIRSMFVACK